MEQALYDTLVQAVLTIYTPGMKPDQIRMAQAVTDASLYKHSD